MMAGILVVLVAMLVGVVVVVAWFLTVYNGLIAARGECDRSWANIDVLLKQRHDELPKLVEVCKGYMAHERQTLEAVMAARNRFSTAQGPEQQAAASAGISGALRQLFAVAENYPQLQAEANFQTLQGRISALESQIADRRELYNAAANGWNVRIAQVPDVILARAMGMKERALWRAEAADREDAKLGFAV
jgi:LemA protein